MAQVPVAIEPESVDYQPKPVAPSASRFLKVLAEPMLTVLAVAFIAVGPTR